MARLIYRLAKTYGPVDTMNFLKSVGGNFVPLTTFTDDVFPSSFLKILFLLNSKLLTWTGKALRQLMNPFLFLRRYLSMRYLETVRRMWRDRLVRLERTLLGSTLPLTRTRMDMCL
jgi:hypothetical protein